MNKILITGTNGFIGKSLTELLDKTKYEIIPVNRGVGRGEWGKNEIHGFDLLDSDEVDEMFKIHKNIDYIIHCATVGGRRNQIDTPYVFSANVSMFENLNKHKNKYKHLFVFGSGAELVEGDFPLKYYGLSKKYITEKIKQENLNCIVLRLWGCFGKYETEDRFIKSNMNNKFHHQPMIIHKNKLMDFFYVNDLIPILDDLMINHNLSKEVNVCYKSKYTLWEVANMLNNITTSNKVRIKFESEDTDEAYTGKYQDYMNKFNFIGLEEGIKQIYEKY